MNIIKLHIGANSKIHFSIFHLRIQGFPQLGQPLSRCLYVTDWKGTCPFKEQKFRVRGSGSKVTKSPSPGTSSSDCQRHLVVCQDVIRSKKTVLKQRNQKNALGTGLHNDCDNFRIHTGEERALSTGEISRGYFLITRNNLIDCTRERKERCQQESFYSLQKTYNPHICKNKNKNKAI